LDRERSAYVSYRLGDHIYWTSHKLLLRRGETVITDGDHTARTRCGNLVAEVPLGPRSPREPSGRLLDMPFPVDMPLGPPLEFELPPTSEWTLGPPAFEVSPPEPEAGLASVAPPFPLGFEQGGSGMSLPPVVPTPEPGALLLVSAGLVFLLAVRKGLAPPAGSERS
jgi:hypothetical protein